MTRLFRISFWGAAAFAFVMAVLPQPPQLPGHPSDKVQHILAFAVLAALARLAYRRTSLPAIGLALCGFGALIELVQMIPGLNRSAEWSDWLADTATAAVVLALLALVLPAQERSRQSAQPNSRADSANQA